MTEVEDARQNLELQKQQLTTAKTQVAEAKTQIGGASLFLEKSRQALPDVTSQKALRQKYIGLKGRLFRQEVERVGKDIFGKQLIVGEYKQALEQYEREKLLPAEQQIREYEEQLKQYEEQQRQFEQSRDKYQITPGGSTIELSPKEEYEAQVLYQRMAEQGTLAPIGDTPKNVYQRATYLFSDLQRKAYERNPEAFKMQELIKKSGVSQDIFFRLGLQETPLIEKIREIGGVPTFSNGKVTGAEVGEKSYSLGELQKGVSVPVKTDIKNIIDIQSKFSRKDKDLVSVEKMNVLGGITGLSIKEPAKTLNITAQKTNVRQLGWLETFKQDKNIYVQDNGKIRRTFGIFEPSTTLTFILKKNETDFEYVKPKSIVGLGFDVLYKAVQYPTEKISQTRIGSLNFFGTPLREVKVSRAIAEIPVQLLYLSSFDSLMSVGKVAKKTEAVVIQTKKLDASKILKRWEQLLAQGKSSVVKNDLKKVKDLIDKETNPQLKQQAIENIQRIAYDLYQKGLIKAPAEKTASVITKETPSFTGRSILFNEPANIKGVSQSGLIKKTEPNVLFSQQLKQGSATYPTHQQAQTLQQKYKLSVLSGLSQAFQQKSAQAQQQPQALQQKYELNTQQRYRQAQKLAVLNLFGQAQGYMQKYKQKPRERFAKPKIKPKKPTKPKFPFFNPQSTKQKIARAILNKQADEFEVFTRTKGEDILIGKAPTKQKAKEILKQELVGTLRASGFIEEKRTGRKLSAGEIDLGFGYAPSKIEKFRVVQRKETRLGTGGEVFEIQQKKKKKRNIWF